MLYVPIEYASSVAGTSDADNAPETNGAKGIPAIVNEPVLVAPLVVKEDDVTSAVCKVPSVDVSATDNAP